MTLLTSSIYAKEIEEKESAKVQIALLLDTSSSMSGLIDQAKTQLWKVVNSFAKVEKDEKVPTIEVALYEYGNSKLSIRDSYIRQLSPLTSELDVISEHLFSLTTNGGDEYCGAVIGRSLVELDWDASSGVYKSIFIAGNEPFTQGTVSATEQCQRAISKGIVVNTIHCGDEISGINGGWKAGAIAAEGDFLTINKDQAIVHIEAPQDKIIIELSGKLNATYIPYGRQGEMRLESQAVQDNNANRERKKGASLNRAITKSSSLYSNTAWDAVDLYNENPEALKGVDTALLPKEMQKMNLEQRKAYVEQKTEERAVIQKQIKELNEEREVYIVKEKAKLSMQDGEDTLDEAMVKAIHRQIAKNGFTLK